MLSVIILLSAVYGFVTSFLKKTVRGDMKEATLIHGLYRGHLPPARGRSSVQDSVLFTAVVAAAAQTQTPTHTHTRAPRIVVICLVAYFLCI